jgi:hypothetical protein
MRVNGIAGRTSQADCEPPQRGAEVVLGRGPLERAALAREFLEGLAIGGGGFEQVRGARFALAKALERVAEVALCPGPLEGTRSRVRSLRASR